MAVRFRIASMTRGLLLAGLAWIVISGDMTVLGADLSSLKGASLRGLDGKRVDLAAPPNGATVLVFYSTECPISNSYSPTFTTLIDAFPAKSVKWIGVCVDPDLSDSEVETHARDFRLKFPVVRDRHGVFARKVGVKTTPEALAIDKEGAIRYRGRIDDQFVARRVRNAVPSGNELKDAIAAVLNGREVKAPFVEAVGCPLPEAPAVAVKPTYCKDVAPILQKNCQECHRPGQVGPFALETYEQARKRATDIATVVDDRAMPPWKAAPHVGVKFKDARTLSDQEIATLVAWSEADAPQGNPADLPTAPKFPDDWQLGTPDLIVDIGADFAVPADGDDIYRCFVVPTHLEKDQYVSAVEYRPGNRRVVHHVLAYVDTSGKARERDQADPGPGYTCFGGPGEPIHGGLGGWAPGNLPSQLDEGIGRSLPRQSDIIIQVHYHPRGKAETDRTKIGLYFARKPVKQIMHWSAAVNPELVLPPGESSIEVKAAWQVPVDVVAHAVTPHMHLLGRDMLMSVKFPDGRVQDLIKIDEWDFNWQYTYYFEKPLDLPKGTVLNLVSHYDNSATNPRNPNKPPKEIRWGEATTDEMCIGFIGVTKKGQDLTKPGEKDDFKEILKKQAEEFREKYEKAKREAAAKDGPKKRDKEAGK
jgi:mono/diheme cytochrome c family protein/alkyl hydroperoxide reductase subunit AhpC